jgi:hypothetical protein
MCGGWCRGPANHINGKTGPIVAPVPGLPKIYYDNCSQDLIRLGKEKNKSKLKVKIKLKEGKLDLASTARARSNKERK